MSAAKKIDLEKISAEYKAAAKKIRRRIVLCAGTGCVANGSMLVRDALVKALAAANLPVEVEMKAEKEVEAGATYVSKSGCQGFCQRGPLLHIEPDGILYTKVKVADVPEIVERTLMKGEVIERLLYRDSAGDKPCLGNHEIPFYSRQTRVVLANCMTDPGDICEYIARGGYFGARRAILEMTSEEICQTALDAGLRGRGGGGFNAGRKWQASLVCKSDKKYVICNGDEGDPGAFMDRSVMEGNPHSIIEGMMIAARGIGSDEGYVYVRAEYPMAVQRVRAAVADAEKAGILGDRIFGSDFSFRINVMEGAGAFICGEATAMIASIEGRRGMPRPKPPYTAACGLWGKPTILNNVETLASVPVIFRDGIEKYRSIGTELSPGTKTFALTGHVANSGLIEVPFGSTLREIVYNIGGGVTDNAGNATNDDFKAVQIGGPSGGCLTPEMLDLPLDFDSLKSVGAMVGSGGLVVINKESCIVKIARFFMQFTQNESCGKCIPCREGTKQMLALLDDIIEGRATAETLSLLEETAKVVRAGSLCGLGKSAPNPVLSTLQHFREEYESHVFKKCCPTGECKALAKPEIDPAKCKGCTACSRKCPVGAISGKVKEPHQINVELCIKCGACKATCKFGAITGL